MPKADSELTTVATNEVLFEQSLMMLESVVKAACLRCNHRPTKKDVDRLSHRLVVLLLENNQHRLRTFSHQSSLKTWLQTLANHYVSRYLRRERRQISLAELPADFFTHDPLQDDETWEAEKMKLLNKAIKRLTKRERELLALLRQDGLTSADIAQKMGIQTESVYRAKNELINKLQRLLGMPS